MGRQGDPDDRRVEIEVVTERRSLVVRESALRGGHMYMDVDVCMKCGAIVFHPFQHDEWHRSLAP